MGWWGSGGRGNVVQNSTKVGQRVARLVSTSISDVDGDRTVRVEKKAKNSDGLVEALQPTVERRIIHPLGQVLEGEMDVLERDVGEPLVLVVRGGGAEEGAGVCGSSGIQRADWTCHNDYVTVVPGDGREECDEFGLDGGNGVRDDHRDGILDLVIKELVELGRLKLLLNSDGKFPTCKIESDKDRVVERLGWRGWG